MAGISAKLANRGTASVIGVLGVPNTRPGWLCPVALNQARATRSFSLLVNRPTGPACPVVWDGAGRPRPYPITDVPRLGWRLSEGWKGPEAANCGPQGTAGRPGS